MWLLDTSTLVLKYSTEDVKYAILSHTWGSNDEEVTFQEWQAQEWFNAKHEVKTGYHKIKRTCEVAKQNGLSWAWVDTCCINKESSAELTEAINSMWQWYRDASVCYAYLPDVSSGFPSGKFPVLTDTELNGSSWYSALAASKWFTRGWTLQELIAPKSMIFYGREWNYIGCKHDMTHTLWKITGVDELALENRDSLSFFVTARKMSWAANRKTTRLEDRAYSLLGVFGVTMPLLYGEGSRAFVRLQEAIITTSTDHSIFAWNWLPKQPVQPQKSLDMLFAVSPDQFSHCASIVPDTRDLFSTPFRLTNSGIHFERIRLAKDQGLCYIVLNCRYERDFKGPIVLQLVQNDALTERFDSRHRQSASEYWLPTSRNRVSVGDYTDQPFVSCSVLRHHPTDSLMLPKGLKTIPPKFWLVKRSTSVSDFEIIESDPPGAWDYENRTMCLPTRQSYPDTVLAWVAIWSPGQISHIVFSFTPMSKRQQASQNPHDIRIAVSCSSRTEAIAELETKLPCLEAYAVTKRFRRNVHVSVSDFTGYPRDGIFEIAVNFSDAMRDGSRNVFGIISNYYNEFSNYYQPPPIGTYHDGPRPIGSITTSSESQHSTGSTLASRYIAQESTFYVPGKVFDLLWAETAGAPYTDIDRYELAHTFVKERRFVCISTTNEHCHAVPVVTYGQQETVRPDIVVATYAVIHTGENASRATPKSALNEPALQPPIRVTADRDTDKLHPQSCIDFGSSKYLKTSLEVRSFGMVHPDSMDSLMAHFCKCDVKPS